MIKLRSERFSIGTFQKLHARGAGPFKILQKIGSNAYILELPSDLGISLTFNISDLIEYKEPMMIPSEPFRPDHVFESEPVLECPPTTIPQKRENFEQILDDKIVTTRNKDYYRYLVRWQGRPESDNSWVTKEDLQRIDPDLLEHYQSQVEPYSTGSSSRHLGRFGADTTKGLQSLWLDTGRSTDASSAQPDSSIIPIQSPLFQPYSTKYGNNQLIWNKASRENCYNNFQATNNLQLPTNNFQLLVQQELPPQHVDMATMPPWNANLEATSSYFSNWDATWAACISNSNGHKIM